MRVPWMAAAASALMTSTLLLASPALATSISPLATSMPALPGSEAEPNNTPATATPITSGERLRAPLFPNGDIDLYQFTAHAGDRVYAATMTSGSASSSTDSRITVLGADGSTVLEFDDDNGQFASLSSSISGTTIPADGTYYLQVNDFTPVTTSERPYDLYFQLRTGAPTPEAEPNDTPGTATPLTTGYAAGARDPALATERDWYSVALEAGDTIFLSLDLDPERDGVNWNGRLGFGLLGDATNQIVVVDDTGAAETPNPTLPSEAMLFTAKTTGTYYAFVDSATAATGGPTATYRLSASVIKAATPSCRSYPLTGATSAIDPSPGLTSFSVNVEDPAIIDRLAVSIDLTHAQMNDLDVSLRSPSGNDVGLFTDIGSSAPDGQQHMEATFDQYAATPPVYTVLRPLMLQPELSYRLSWFDGEQASGTWTLDIRDDNLVNGGTLNDASITLCARPDEGPTADVFSTDFEAGDAGFTHSGTLDEWERGLPATVATTTSNSIAGLSTCHSGTNCWKTDLDNTYNVSSTQDLLSPPIDLTARSGKIYASWWQWHQMESASFDHITVDAQLVAGASPQRLYTWLDATMTNPPGNPIVNIGASSGWAQHVAEISSFAGQTIELRFHLDSDTTVNLAGMAVDDVRVFQPQRTLSVATAGSGAGYVSASSGPIDCGTSAVHAVCSGPYALGSAVTLTAHPDAGSTFAGFSGGGCSGDGLTCAVTLDDARSVTAMFAATTSTPPPPPPPGPAPRDTTKPTLRVKLGKGRLTPKKTAKLTITVSEASTVAGTLSRRTCRRTKAAKRVCKTRTKKIRLGARKPGSSSAKIALKKLKLKPGTYTLSLTALDAAGNRSKAAKVKLKLRR